MDPYQPPRDDGSLQRVETELNDQPRFVVVRWILLLPFLYAIAIVTIAFTAFLMMKMAPGPGRKIAEFGLLALPTSLGVGAGAIAWVALGSWLTPTRSRWVPWVLYLLGSALVLSIASRAGSGNSLSNAFFMASLTAVTTGGVTAWLIHHKRTKRLTEHREATSAEDR